MTDVRAQLADIQAYGAWAVIRRKAAPTAGLVGGTPREVASILDIPLEEGLPEPGRFADRLVAVPFRQVRERGFEAIDDGTPLVVVDVEAEHEVQVDDLLAALPDVDVELADRGGFDSDDASYGKVVDQIIRDEIGQGEGANLVIGRHYRAIVADWDAARALTVFRRLLEREAGAYWTFCFFTGDRYLIGASPERHVSVRGGDVRMNPISGTFRVRSDGDQDGDIKDRLLDFLADEKEIYELFMVVDEELKMMCDICHEGGQVLGPFLKPMTHLVHTEYLLAGRSDRDPREILRDTMYAATVTGSPVENACRLIASYEPDGRGYYGAALALFGRDPEGRPTMDSPILIRTADVDIDGRLKVTAGATLVRDSEASYEVAETHAKASGILSAFGLVPPALVPALDVAALARDEDVLIALNSRNRRLSTFWLADQAGSPPDPALRGQHVRILDGEDDFVNMLRHVLSVLGMTSDVVRHDGVRRGVSRRGRPGHRRTRSRRPARWRRPEDGDPARSGRPAARAAAAVPRRVPGAPGPLSPARAAPGVQGHRVPGHAVVGHDGRPDRAGRLLQHLRGPNRRHPARRGLDRGRSRHRRRPSRARPPLPRHPVPRRVDPHRARLRPDPRPGARARRQLAAPPWRTPDVVVVDHHDSYTWNLVHLVAAVTGVLPAVVQHDEVAADDVLRHTHVVLSPGPGHPAVPADFSVGRDVLLAATRPVLGVCLGMQGLVTAYGGTVDRVDPGARQSWPGSLTTGSGLFTGLPGGFAAVRYHSLAALTLPPVLRTTATDDVSGLVMGVAHRGLPLSGVQFHPESILSEHGEALVRNFLAGPG